MENEREDFSLKNMKGLSRRKFLALMSASAAFATVGCKEYHHKGEIVPYTRMPEEITPGIANYYASTYNGYGVLIKTREGRPIKIDGNPGHPINRGKIDNQTQAGILNLYDPQRLKYPMKKVGNKFEKDTWENIDKKIIEELNQAKANNKEIAIITHTIQSPTQWKLFEDFKAVYPNTKIFSYELFNDLTRKWACKVSYGTRSLPQIKWNEANVILSLESDFLGIEGNVVEQMRMFSERRNVNEPDKFNRLYIAEAGMSLTGANADYRLILTPEEQLYFVFTLLNVIINDRKFSKINIENGFNEFLSIYKLNLFASKNKISIDILKNLVDDLIKNAGRSIIYAGDTLDGLCFLAVNCLNEVLGNDDLFDWGKTDVEYNQLIPLKDYGELIELIDKINNKNIGAIVHFDSNPAFHFPVKFEYEKALKNVKTVISLVESENESSFISDYLLPINHALESWGDCQTRTDIMSLQQPVIAPLYDTRQKEEILLGWLNSNPEFHSGNNYHQYLMNRWKTEVYPKLNLAVEFDKFWYSSLHDGFIEFKLLKNEIPKFQFNLLDYLPFTKIVKKGFTLILKKSYSIGDGRYASNGWLQELPHPMSKITWDNYAAISPATGKKLGVENNDFIEVSLNIQKQKFPVLIQPGMADEVVSVELGYGRTHAGIVGTGVGVNAGVLMSASIIISPWIMPGAQVKKVPGKYNLGISQEIYSIDDSKYKNIQIKREIIKEGTVAEFKKEPHFLHNVKEHELYSITPDIEYKGVKWGMAIDLNKCNGCGYCISSCNVENNVPVVGKEQILRNRKMHWIRIDRYYEGNSDNPKVNLQPILCQHCDNAPCENVCPVAATNHSPDGLNQMAYNRCVGTRYCSNNCPYKVRHYNFLNFRDDFRDGIYQSDSLKLLHNPEVTVRSRGVMEKCSFCIQRIMEARQNATKEGRKLKGTDVQTACQVACPANAIMFGDVNDPDSNVSKLKKHNLAYHVLEFLNIKPNVTYIAKLRNIHEEEV